MTNNVQKYVKELVKRADVPEEVKNALASAESKGEAKRIWKEHIQTTGAKKGEWLDGE